MGFADHTDGLDDALDEKQVRPPICRFLIEAAAKAEAARIAKERDLAQLKAELEAAHDA